MSTYVTLLSMCSSITEHALYIAVAVICEFHCVSICSWLPLCKAACLVSWRRQCVRPVDGNKCSCSLGCMSMSLDTAYGAGFYTIVLLLWPAERQSSISGNTRNNLFDLATERIPKQSVIQLLRYSLKCTRHMWNCIPCIFWCCYVMSLFSIPPLMILNS